MNVCYYGTEALSQRTLSSGKDYRNSSKDYKLQTPALYFPNQIPSGLPLPPPLPLFLSKMDDLPRGITTNKGLNKRRCYSPPPPLASHPFISPSIFPSSAIYGKFFKLPSRFPPPFFPFINPFSHTVILVFFLKGEQYAMDAESPYEKNSVTAKETFCCTICHHHHFLGAFTKKVGLFAIHHVFIHILTSALNIHRSLNILHRCLQWLKQIIQLFIAYCSPAAKTIVPSQF